MSDKRIEQIKESISKISQMCFSLQGDLSNLKLHHKQALRKQVKSIIVGLSAFKHKIGMVSWTDIESVLKEMGLLK